MVLAVAADAVVVLIQSPLVEDTVADMVAVSAADMVEVLEADSEVVPVDTKSKRLPQPTHPSISSLVHTAQTHTHHFAFINVP